MTYSSRTEVTQRCCLDCEAAVVFTDFLALQANLVSFANKDLKHGSYHYYYYSHLGSGVCLNH